MRRDFTIGLLVSAGLHLAAVWTSQLNRSGPPKALPKDVGDKLVELVMPKLEPDEPEVTENQEQPATPVLFSPPMLSDVPQLTTDTSFTQQIQPPPPEGAVISANAFIIPEGRPGSLNGVQVFDPAKLDKQPTARYQARPQYPFEMRHAGLSGEVLVDFVVDSTGEVKNAYAVTSSQHEFEAAAVQAVGKWKFTPGRKGGKAVNTHMQVPIVFTLNQDN